MNILFLTLVGIASIEDRGIYQDLLRKFRDEGHQVTIVCPVERRLSIATNLQHKEGVQLLQVKTLNITKAHFFEKGIGTFAIEYQYLNAIKKYLKNHKFDLVLYSTPPITFEKVISYIKKRDGAYTYLLLKDIFPQNAVDMGMLKENGFLHKLFLKKEKKLYQVSDTIGCMSPANSNFILKNHSEIPFAKVEENPNSIQPIQLEYNKEQKEKIRIKYEIPIDKKILVYGGNLGKPQGLDFLLQTIQTCDYKNAFFLIVGDGTEFDHIQKWFTLKQPTNAKIIKSLPKSDYDLLLASCDIGLIFLHPDFLIPNFPSRLLSYLEMKMPVIAATDKNTDIGDIIETAACGIKIITGDIEGMRNAVNHLVNEADLIKYGENSWKLLNQHYKVDRSYQLIISKL